jgi:hypothetical protein
MNRRRSRPRHVERVQVEVLAVAQAQGDLQDLQELFFPARRRGTPLPEAQEVVLAARSRRLLG